MTFAVVAHDHKDKDALARRMRARPEHLANGDLRIRQGIQLYGVGLTNDNGDLVGSIMLFEVRDRAHLDEVLKSEPYITANVWQEINVYPARVAPSFSSMRPAGAPP